MCITYKTKAKKPKQQRTPQAFFWGDSWGLGKVGGQRDRDNNIKHLMGHPSGEAAKQEIFLFGKKVLKIQRRCVVTNPLLLSPPYGAGTIFSALALFGL